MSVNLNKNKVQIIDAWNKVTNNEDGYDWALFGYEGKSVDLKVVSKVLWTFFHSRMIWL